MNKRKILYTFFLVLSLGSAKFAQAAVDMFLAFPDTDISGESQDAKHTDEIDVLSWSWGLAPVDDAKSSSKAKPQDLAVVKYVDSATSSLVMSAAMGQNLGRAVLTVRKQGKVPTEFIVLTFNDVKVSSFQTGGSGGEDRLTETFTLSYSSVFGVYTPIAPDGSALPGVPFDWNIASNEKL